VLKCGLATFQTNTTTTKLVYANGKSTNSSADLDFTNLLTNAEHAEITPSNR
jgi:hypothetical protein